MQSSRAGSPTATFVPPGKSREVRTTKWHADHPTQPPADLKILLIFSILSLSTLQFVPLRSWGAGKASWPALQPGVAQLLERVPSSAGSPGTLTAGRR